MDGRKNRKFTIDLTGQKINRLTVIGLSDEPSNHDRKWLCQCECGNMVSVVQADLRRAHTKSCGCAKKGMGATHGLTSKYRAEYTAWSSMKWRCSAKSTGGFKSRYFERGIRVADEWMDDFAAFFYHIGPRPDKGYSVDRIDNERNYEPGNVRWATNVAQSNNRSMTLRVMFRGELRPVSTVATMLGIPYYKVHRWAVMGGSRCVQGTELEGMTPIVQQQERYPLANGPIIGAIILKDAA